MIKKILIFSLVLLFLFTGVASAHSANLPEPGMLPDNPFYFLKSWSEGFGTLFTLGAVAKAERFAYLSEKRLSEADELSEGDNPEKAKEAIERYQKNIEKAVMKATEAKEKGLDIDEVLEHISTMTLKHQEVLATVYEKGEVEKMMKTNRFSLKNKTARPPINRGPFAWIA